MIKHTLLALAMLPFVALAQLPCGTDHAVEQSLKNNPHLRKTLENLEEFTAGYMPLANNTKRIIPVVVHIVHNYGPENISDAQVHDAIRVLNEDFNLENADTNQIVEFFKPRLGNTGFEFRLAKIDPNGKCTNGITRTQSTLTLQGSDNVKDLISWDTRKYYNIWVVASIASGAGAYAYYPGTAPSSRYEGVITRYTQFGSIGPSSGNFAARTMTHETGHYFNLRHTWGNNNNCGSGGCTGQGDLVDDTPFTPGNCLSCNLTSARCGGNLENVQNFMDYATCIRMFTAGQSARMQAAAAASAGGRNNLWTEQNLIATGVNDGYQASPCAPTADLPNTLIQACSNDSIEFRDISHGTEIDQSYTWQWEFPGGNPATSNMQNPKVRYANAGSFDVRLTVSNSAGTSFIERKNMVRIYPSQSDVPVPFYQNFDGDFPGSNADFWKNWQVNSVDGSRNWFRTSQAALSPPYSMAVISNDVQAANTTYKMRTPSINVQAATKKELTFDRAYSFRSGTRDRLRVNVSRDCGLSFFTIAQFAQSQLNTTPGQSLPSFIPNSSEWVRQTIDISSLASDASVIFEFEYINLETSTANIYLDNINIGDFNTGLADLYRPAMTLFPNPVNMSGILQLSGIESGTPLTFFDVNGRELQTVILDGNTLPLSSAGITAPGIYMVKSADNQSIGKLVVIP